MVGKNANYLGDKGVKREEMRVNEGVTPIPKTQSMKVSNPNMF